MRKWPAVVLAAVILAAAIHKSDKENAEQKAQTRTKVIPNAQKVPGQEIRGYDFKAKTYIMEQVVEDFKRVEAERFPTNRELQELRELQEYDKDGRYFHIPGKRILTREQEMQEAIERYIEDNIDDILDEYGY